MFNTQPHKPNTHPTLPTHPIPTPPTQVHWLGTNQQLPPRYEVHGSALVATQEPGFVVRGFLWCAKKSEPQLAAEQKEIHKLDSKWPDNDTRDIVSTVLYCTVGREGVRGAG